MVEGCSLLLYNLLRRAKDLNWFKLIASFSGISIQELWENIILRSKNLIRLHQLYNMKSIKRGIETAKGMKVQAVFIPSSKDRAIRREDHWILHEIIGTKLIVRNRDVENMTIDIPISCVLPALRTIANNPYMDLSGNNDYVVVEDFQGSDIFFFGERRRLREALPNWKEYVKDRMGNLIILRRFPINAPGISYLCYYSSTPIAGPGTTWVANLPNPDAKILCLWFNSSLHLLQVIKERVEDVWLDIHKYILKDMFVLNTKTLSKDVRENLLLLFEQVSRIRFPSLEEQYLSGFKLKERIDEAMLTALGYDEKESKQILKELYLAIKQHFHALKELSQRSKSKI